MSLDIDNRILDFFSGCVLAIERLNSASFSTSLPAALKQLAVATGADRVSVYELCDAGLEAPVTALLVSESRVEQFDGSGGSEIGANAEDAAAYDKNLPFGGQAETVHVPEFHRLTSLSRLAEKVGHRTVVSAPIEMDAKPWGVLRLEFSCTDIVWTVQHELVLRSLATFIGSVRSLEARIQATEEAGLLSLSQLAAENEIAFELDANGNWTFLSPAWDRLTGYSARRALGSHHSRYLLHHPGGSVGALSELNFLDGITTQGASSGEALLKAEDGSYLWVSFLIRAVPARDGLPARYQGLLTDIRNRKSQEAHDKATAEELQAKNADLLAALVTAQEATRLRGDFLATMSHEIRTPLNGVLGMTSLLLETSLDRQQREFGLAIQSSAESLLSVVNSILDYSKLEAQHMELEDVYYDPRALVEEVFASLAEPASRKRIDLVVHPHIPMPAEVRGDPGKVRQVLLNLVGNAIKFSKTGEVVVSVWWEPLFERSGELRFDVIDSGIGMSQETVSHLFQPFHQAVAATSRIYGGTGLGLAISKRLCELMGGDIAVESQLGEGSRFQVVLPTMCKDRPDDGHHALSPIGFFQDKRVLLAGVGDLSAAAWLDALREQGAEASRVANLTSIIDSLSSEPSDLPADIIIFDTRNLEQDVSEVNRRIRLATRNPHLFLVLLDSIHSPVDRSVLKGVDPPLVIRKPVSPSRVLEMISSAQSAVAHALRKLMQRSARPLAESSTEDSPVLLLASSERRRKCLAFLLRAFSVNLVVAENFPDLIQQAIGKQHALVLLDADIGIHTEADAARKLRETLGLKAPPIVGMANSLSARKYLEDSGLFDDVLREGFQRADLQRVMEQFVPMNATTARAAVS
ncbi:MAG: PAS domain S-box protein [Bryobacterales bacterium]|nr:PAS domain S-box protein [Bryobacterales bacterium]